MLRSVVALLALTLVVPVAHAHDEDPVEAVLSDPRATGLLVMTVIPGNAAHAAGIEKGDVLLSYDGTAVATEAALAAAKEGAKEKESVVVALLRAGGERAEVSVAPGPLGVNVVPIEEGKPPVELPDDTGARLDPAVADGIDEWFVLSTDGTARGMEHVTVRVEGDVLTFTHEVAADFGEEWGLHHAVVRGAIRCGVTAEPVHLTYENPLNGWISRSRVVRDAAGRATWRAAGNLPGDVPQVSDKPLRGDQSSLPSYAVAQIARLLPQEEGACLRFRPVADWDGEPGLSAALVCVGEETVTIGEAEHATWRFEQRQLGRGVVSTYWFDAGRRLVKADYGGPVGTTATKEEALAVVAAHEGLTPRTAE